MKKIGRLLLVLTLALTIIAPEVFPIAGNAIVAEAAAIKISKKSITLEVGKTTTLKISGTKKKVTWTSSKKSVATVTSKGKVTAIGAGNATITANVGGNKLSCTVNVVAPNKYLKDAPFDAVEKNIGGISIVVPKDYTYSLENSFSYEYSAMLTPADAYNGSNITIGINKTGSAAEDYEVLKLIYNSTFTQELFQTMIENTYDPASFKIEDFNNSDFMTNLGYAFRSSYELTVNVDGNNYSLEQANYMLAIDGYEIDVTVNDADNLDLDAVAQFILNSVVATK